MQVRVVHLYKKWEELNRDILELTKLKDRIAENREYSEFVKESIQSEIDKLNQHKNQLMDLVVESPPARYTGKRPNQQTSDEKILMEKESTYREELSRKQENPPHSKPKLKSERPVYKY